MGVFREGEIQPFAQQFMKPIPDEEVLDASGHYDEGSQTWILDQGAKPASTLASGFNPERPPTTCSRMTRVGVGDYRSDTYVDD